MSPSAPARLSLARRPTPVESFTIGDGVRVLIKRDDLTGVALSGNKVRKLDYLLAAARGASRVVTCGGVNSNHARATAVACAQLGLPCRLVLRGEDRRPPTGNLLLSRFVGASIRFIAAEEWKRVDEIMAEEAGTDGYVIPEGGSNGLGCLGYVDAAEELLEELGDRVGRIVHAVGSGGTTAGLALGLARAGRTDVEVVGVCVCDDGPSFDRRIRGILDDAVDRGHVGEAEASAARWRIQEGFVGPGYAETDEAAMAELRSLARHGLILDPVYSGKAFRALPRLDPTEGETVFIHTGGIFELFAFADQI